MFYGDQFKCEYLIVDLIKFKGLQERVDKKKKKGYFQVIVYCQVWFGSLICFILKFRLGNEEGKEREEREFFF